MSSIIIRNSTISGLHATKCSSNPEVTLLVCPDTTWKDSNAMKVVVPHLENLPLDSHDLVTWPKNHARKRFVDQKIRDVAGKKVGNVPANLCGVFKDLLDEGIATRITARSTAMKPRVSTRPCTQQSFQKRPGLDRRGGGVVLDCIYIVHVHVTSYIYIANLYRGVKFNRATTKEEELPSMREFAEHINHAGPSITNTVSSLPSLKYENKTYHTSEILFHLKILMKNEDSLRYQFADGVTRFPVVIGIDEQELNQGTYIVNGELCGLEEKMTAKDVIRVVLKNFGNYVAQEKNFVSAAREYHATDLAGIFCSNIYTAFESHCLKSDECLTEMDEMVVVAVSCESCLHSHLDCKYANISHRCDHCINADRDCISLVVFHVYFDMGSSQKKATDENPNLLDLDCSEEDMMSPRKYTVGFGGLHLAKALINK